MFTIGWALSDFSPALTSSTSNNRIFSSSGVGLYLHVPFCHRICHYCDFAKTANFGGNDVGSFARELANQIELFGPATFPEKGLSSIFLGGGTPSLLGENLHIILDAARPWITSETEVTLEANPEDVLLRMVECWVSAGVTRLSLGVQSFCDEGLRALTRNHSGRQAEEAIEMAPNYFGSVNCDLIFGWSGQTISDWNRDLEKVIHLELPHLSIYNLTYEGNTVLARRHRRGVLPKLPDETEELMFISASETLLGAGYRHEEVSNYAKKGHSCKHNWLYWGRGQYVGLGPGAHGFIHHGSHAYGLRYEVPYKKRLFSSDLDPSVLKGMGLWHLMEKLGFQVEERGAEEWLVESVWTGLRTYKGIDIRTIMELTGAKWVPTPSVEYGLKNDILFIEGGDVLKLRNVEWFRESKWAFEVSESFRI